MWFMIKLEFHESLFEDLLSENYFWKISPLIFSRMPSNQ